MSTTLADTLQTALPSSDRLRLLDRAALQVGVALIRWADRSERARSRRLAVRREQAERVREVAVLRRELEHERVLTDSYLLLQSRR